MPRLVISTVGTSLLTNQIDREFEDNWAVRLRETANYSSEEIEKHHEDVSDIITILKERAEEKLKGEVEEIREASAELNGIYALYKEQLSQGTQDIHWLIASDTAQDQVTAKMLEVFLRQQSLTADVFKPKNFSARSTEAFTNGIDELLEWIDDIVPGYRDSGYQICFNLVGGFKAIQGFANTIGMFYADEIIYIFEGSQDFITIPRLPIQVDKSVIKPVQFALMASEVGIWVKLSELQGVRETLIFVVGEEATLSNWGRLTWNSCKRELLARDLLDFPCLVYKNYNNNSFIKDYQKNNVDAQRKFELHEVLAEVSGSMIKFKGDSTRFDSRLHFTRYEGGEKCEGGVRKNQIDHFYIKNTGWRVSCIAKDGKLYLRHYGEHDYVNDNP
ncbi:MAG TPA: CRISPR-associated protein [Cyanobacteria bacterium UBA8553]|nr:CRISPR-associated protein [Cyanobacteria bacterium UBA8553]HAJ61816.1 CRISPR-associated protein [Cyanobacteria bacterium UBA8543]